MLYSIYMYRSLHSNGINWPSAGLEISLCDHDDEMYWRAYSLSVDRIHIQKFFNDKKKITFNLTPSMVAAHTYTHAFTGHIQYPSIHCGLDLRLFNIHHMKLTAVNVEPQTKHMDYIISKIQSLENVENMPQLTTVMSH